MNVVYCSRFAFFPPFYISSGFFFSFDEFTPVYPLIDDYKRSIFL